MNKSQRTKIPPPKNFEAVKYNDSDKIYYRCLQKMHDFDTEIQCIFHIRSDKFRKAPSKAEHKHQYENITFYTTELMNKRSFQNDNCELCFINCYW